MIEQVSIYIGLAIASVGGIFAIYDRFTKPDIKAGRDIDLMKQGCQFKHEAIDKDIASINRNLYRLRKNHIDHMERDIKTISDNQIRILAILGTKQEIENKINQ